MLFFVPRPRFKSQREERRSYFNAHEYLYNQPRRRAPDVGNVGLGFEQCTRG